MKALFNIFKVRGMLMLMVFVGVCALIGKALGWSDFEAPLVMFGMAEIKSMASIADKWTRVTPGRSEDYKLGVANPKRDWQKATEGAAGNWKAGIDAAASKGLFAKGVNAAGTKKWQDKAMTKGPGRFSEGVYIAGPDYQKGFAPYREAIAKTDLGPKFPRRDPRNIERVKKIVDALISAKLGA